MRIGEVRLLYARGHCDGPVVAVQDVFGKAYRRFHRPHRVGETCGATVVRGEVEYSAVYRILSPRVSRAIVAQVVQRSPRWPVPLDDGYWYEVISD